MPYTLVKALVWLLVVFVLGVVIGWLLRNATVRREMAKARGDAAEQDRLRERVAELEPLIDERTRLVAELEAARSKRGRAAPAPTSDPSAAASPAPSTEAPEPPSEPARTEPTVEPGAAPDLEAAAATLGRPVELDDLKVVEGIGPQIEELCHGIGIRTWADLAGTEASLLRTMLDDAGARYKVHDPETWPAQAGLLADGRWEELRDLVGRNGGDAEPS